MADGTAGRGDANAVPWARWPAVAIIAAGAATYANALGHPFIFDDGTAIVDNPTIRSLGASVFGGPAQFPTAGRPLVNISFAVNYLLGGVSPWGYHLVNLGVHLACALLVFALLRRMLMLARMTDWSGGRATGIATAVALLWTVHPLNSEIVNYATQRTEALMALTFLATLYAGVRACSTDRPLWWSMASVTVCAAGMAAKESMVTAPIVMLVLDAAFISGGVVIALRRRPMYYLALCATWIVLVLLLIEGPRFRSAGFDSGVSPWTYLLNQAPMIARYVRLVFWPTRLVLDYGEPLQQTLGGVWPSALLIIAMLAGALALWTFDRALAFFATWFFITLAPTSSILPIATEVGAERRMYLPLVGMLSLIVILASRFTARTLTSEVRQRVAVATVASGCIVLSTVTMARNGEYRSGLGMWQTVVDRHPTGRAHYNLGLELKQAGQRADAIREYQLAVETDPSAHYALGFELDAEGRHNEAVEHYRAFIRLEPDDVSVPRTYHQIGRAMIAMGRNDEAVAAFREALARKRGDVDSLAGLADALLAMQRWTDAVAAYTEFLSRTPSDPAARFNLGLALVRLDRDAEARDAFAAAVQLQPGNVAARVNLAYALANTGRPGDAVTEFRRAAELEKDPSGRASIEGAIAELLGGH